MGVVSRTGLSGEERILIRSWGALCRGEGTVYDENLEGFFGVLFGVRFALLVVA